MIVVVLPDWEDCPHQQTRHNHCVMVGGILEIVSCWVYQHLCEIHKPKEHKLKKLFREKK